MQAAVPTVSLYCARAQAAHVGGEPVNPRSQTHTVNGDTEVSPAPHTVHSIAPSALILPASQSTHSFPLANLPARHAMHTGSPFSSACLVKLTSQTQSSTESDPLTELELAMHSVHTVAADVSEYVSSAQFSQAAEPVASL